MLLSKGQQIQKKMLNKTLIEMKRWIGIMVMASAVGFYSCTDEGSGIVEDGVSFSETVALVIEDDANSSATIDAVFEDVDELADFEGSSISGRQDGPSDDPKGHEMCAVVTYDEATMTKTIDFGEGCTGRDGRVRKGKIIFTKTGEKGEVGEKRTMTFEGFEIDSIQIEGTRSLENISDTTTDDRTIAITLVGGKVTFPDGTVVTRESSRTRVTSFDEEGIKTQAVVFGSSEGTNKDGLAYTHSVGEATPLLFTSACREEKVIAPVSGIKLIQVEGESDKTIDFGDGTCDLIATVTQDGISEDIEIDPKERRRKHPRPRRR